MEKILNYVPYNENIDIKKNILYLLWEAKKKDSTFSFRPDGWENQSVIKNYKEEELKYFQSNEDFHFCIAKINHIDGISEFACKDINEKIFHSLLDIGDSEVGYTQKEKNILNNRKPKIASLVTANHYLYLTFLFDNLPELEKMNILEFGGGYGNICRMLFTYFEKEKINEYCIADQTGMEQLQRYFLKENLKKDNFEKISFVISDNKLELNKNYDLLIANHSLSEFGISKYFEYSHIIKKANYFFYSSTLTTICEFVKVFHLMSEMEIINLIFEPGLNVCHFLFKRR